MQIKAKMYAKKKTGEKKLKGFEKGMEKNWYSQTLLVWGRSQHLCFSMWISNDLAHQEHCIFINHVIAHKGVFIDSNLCSWPFALPHTCTHMHTLAPKPHLLNYYNFTMCLWSWLCKPSRFAVLQHCLSYSWPLGFPMNFRISTQLEKRPALSF